MASEAMEAQLAQTAEAKKAADFANYFCTYSFIYHQKDMLTDENRMSAYYNSIMGNRAQFEGKVVLDVGTGSGILAMWAAQAGARKVYAVEYTDMAVHARKLVEHNGLADTVEVLQGAIEEVEIPEQVDIIVSEWMGYALLRESMIDSVIVARDRFLKPGGAMYPSHATILLAPVAVEQQAREKLGAYQRSMGDWHSFLSETSGSYGIDMGVITQEYDAEQVDYFLRTATWEELSGDQMLAEEANVWKIDMHTCTVEDVSAVRDAPFSFAFEADGQVTGITCYFTTDFHGSTENPTTSQVTLSTSPAAGFTHWGQQLFLLQPPVHVRAGDAIQGTMDITRRAANHRLLNVSLTYGKVAGGAAAGAGAEDGAAQPPPAPAAARTVVYRVD